MAGTHTGRRLQPGRSGLGLSMTVVTHEMGFAREVADRVMFMADGQIVDRVMLMVDGQIVEVGAPNHLFRNPTEERTRLFLSQIL